MSSTRGKSKLFVQPLKSEDDFEGDVAKEWSDIEQDEKYKDIDEETHANLLEALRVLDGKRGRLVQRTEHAAKASEYHKRADAGPSSDSVSYAELVGALHSSASHGELKKQLRTMQERSHVLSEPLPKPASERLQRSVAYEKTARDLSKWEPVIEANRLAEHLHFPLQRPNIRPPSVDGFVQRFQPRTPLEVEIAALLASSDHVLHQNATLTKAEERALRAMDVEEAKRRRAELQKHRALLSYKEAKSYRQNKIKSKRYHRILRKEKQKQEEKTLQALAATDPEAYAQRMDKLDKMRIAERVSLKHRGGSKFAKLKTRYGKHDDISRQAISDMYDQSHRLTQKVQLPEAKEGDKDPDGTSTAGVGAASGRLNLANGNSSLLPSNTKNPWLAAGGGSSSSGNAGTTAKRVQFSLSGMSSTAAPSESSSLTSCVVKAPTPSISPFGDAAGNIVANTTDTQEMTPLKSHSDIFTTSWSIATTNSSSKTTISLPGTDQKESTSQLKAATGVAGCKQKRRKRKAKSNIAGETDIPDAKKLQKQLHRMEENVAFTADGEAGVLVAEEQSDEEMISETLERRQTLGDIDSAMLSEVVSPTQKLKPRQVAALLADDSAVTGAPAAADASNKGRHNKAGKISKQVHVTHSTLPDVVVTGDDGGNAHELRSGGAEQRLNIIEAFADDDVIEEFSREKRALEERDKPKDMDLTLPGWGEWGGAGVLPENISTKKRRKARRFIVKAPPAPPRQDRNMNKVIISQAKNTALAKHQVSELPYPFTSIQQYESSIRMPIGKTWNPETAFRSMTVPRVTTQMGAIIDPIDSSEVFKKQKQKKKQLIGNSNAKGAEKLNGPAGKTGGSAAAGQRQKQVGKKQSAKAAKRAVKTNGTKAKL